MAGSKSDYLETSVLNYWLGKSFTSTAPSTVYMALYNTTINDTWTSTSTGECAGTGYARLAVTNSSANWTNSTSGGSKTNKTVLQFTASAGAGWGTIKTFAILDTTSTSAGNMLYWGDLAVNTPIGTGNIVQFSTGQITITEA
jgi:hypothetical protein